MRKVSEPDFVEPLILDILKKSTGSMTILGINYVVNQSVGKTIDMKIIKNNLTSLTKKQKISSAFNEENKITYYDITI